MKNFCLDQMRGRGIKWQNWRYYAHEIWLGEEIQDEEEDCGVENLSGSSLE